MSVVPNPRRGPIGFRLAHELEGLLRGIVADHVIEPAEIERLRAWQDANRQFRNIAPFSELSIGVDRALEDGHLTRDEVNDLLFVCSKLTTVNPYFDQVRGGAQVLMGVLAGIAADRMLDEGEVRTLSDWLVEWAHLRGLWPYNECESVVTHLLANRRIAEDARYLLALAAEFPIAGGPPDVAAAPLLLSGVCAVDPEIEFRDRSFVFTGRSQKGERDRLATAVLQRGGRALDCVTDDTHYLVVCDDGNEHWAFACYGRKVEKAYNMRRKGHHVRIVAERDFWDATRVSL